MGETRADEKLFLKMLKDKQTLIWRSYDLQLEIFKLQSQITSFSVARLASACGLAMTALNYKNRRLPACA